MKVWTKFHRFKTVFDNDGYVEIGAEGNGKKSLMAHSGLRKTAEDLFFLPQALESNADRVRFHRSTSPRRCWEEILDWYDTISYAQRVVQDGGFL